MNRTIFTLGAISFLADVASEMLYPITPIFLTTVLSASMLNIGLIEGVAEMVNGILKVYFGNLSDRLSKRRAFIIAGYALSTIAKPVTGLATTWTHVLFSRVLDRVGKGIRTAPRDAMIADSAPESDHGRAFGWHRGMDTAGAIVGPLLALLLMSVTALDLRTYYLIAFIPGILSLWLVLKIKEIPKKISADAHEKFHWRQLKLKPGGKKFLILWAFFLIGNMSDSFAIIKLKEQGLGFTGVILSYVFFNLVYSLSSPFFGTLADKKGTRFTLRLGLLMFCLSYLGFALSESIAFSILSFSAHGLFMGATESVTRARIVSFCEPHQRATGLALLGLVSSFCFLVSNIVGGLLWESMGPSSVFYWGAMTSMLALILL